jgi:hypothetical protein
MGKTSLAFLLLPDSPILVWRTATIGSGEKSPPKRGNLKLGSRKHMAQHQSWQKVQSNNKRTFAKLEKWLDNSSKEIKLISTYLLEHQVEVNISF